MNAFSVRSGHFVRGSALVVSWFMFVTAASNAVAQWTVINLHPAGATESKGYSIRNGVQAGYVDTNAAKWTGNVGSYVNLGGRIAYGTDGVQQAGFHAGGAGVWTGTPGSLIDLTPPPPAPPNSYVGSEAKGVFAGMQVGTNGIFMPTPGGFFTEAGYWLDSAATWTSLHPAGALTSGGEGTHIAAQVGWAQLSAGSGYQRHASLWYNSPVMTDLNPAGAVDSIAYDIFSGVQVGSATFNPGSGPEAAKWTGSAASFVNLHPLPAISSELFGEYLGRQAGYVRLATGRGPVEHASFWEGTAASWQDLHSYLPAGYSDSRAEGVWVSNFGDIWVVGWALNGNGFPEAKLWTTYHFVPEPSSLVLFALGAVAWCGRARRGVRT
jgi:hypothetical protein